jgi:hypothetical protein
MGPRSTIFTWAESFSSLPSDDELEQYVKTPHLVVLPYIDPVEEALMKEKESEGAGEEESREEEEVEEESLCQGEGGEEDHVCWGCPRSWNRYGGVRNPRSGRCG